ncbi:MAG: phosphoribosylaminoimidazolesuccinocarboxamide synthase, partial [Alphaproteobacteria bacterium]
QYHDDHTHLLIADEISPDTCRLWDMRTSERLDKDRFRRDLGNVIEAYQEVARRLGVLPSADVREIGSLGERS